MKIKKNGKVITLTESDLKRIVKRVLTEQGYDYNKIENLTDPNMLFKIINDSLNRYFGDNEAPVEAAFMAMAKVPGLYDKVNKLWKAEAAPADEPHNPYKRMSGTAAVNFNFQDLSHDVQVAIDITKIWHKQSIWDSLTKMGEPIDTKMVRSTF
jgi:hypothetical protein